METGRSKLPIIVSIPFYTDDRGTLLPISIAGLPFDVKRIFTISKMKAWRKRGGHAHKECWQAIYCLEGLVVAKVRPVGSDKSETFVLTDPSDMLIVPAMNFITMENDREGTVILVLCSHEYDKEDYIYENQPANSPI